MQTHFFRASATRLLATLLLITPLQLCSSPTFARITPVQLPIMEPAAGMSESPIATFQARILPASATSSLHVMANHEGGKGIMILIKKPTGQVVFREMHLGTSPYMRMYNLSALPDGEYSLEIRPLQKKAALPYVRTFRIASVSSRQLIVKPQVVEDSFTLQK